MWRSYRLKNMVASISLTEPICPVLWHFLYWSVVADIYIELYSPITVYTAAVKENKSTIKQSSKQHTSIGQMYQMLLTPVSHLNSACAILSD